MRDKALAKAFRFKPCVVCGSLKSEGDHIKSFGSSRKEDEQNMWALCREHHIEKHTIGLTTFVRKHSLEFELEKRGMTRCDLTGKWF